MSGVNGCDGPELRKAGGELVAWQQCFQDMPSIIHDSRVVNGQDRLKGSC